MAIRSGCELAARIHLGAALEWFGTHCLPAGNPRKEPVVSPPAAHSPLIRTRGQVPARMETTVARPRRRPFATLALFSVGFLLIAGGTAQAAGQQHLETPVSELRQMQVHLTPAATLALETGIGVSLQVTPTAGGTLEYPTLIEIQPASASPGQELTVIGTGGYLYDGQGGYNESARSFALYFDGHEAGSLSCYASMCRATLTVPFDATLGGHSLSTEGGSALELQVSEPMDGQ